MIPCRRGVESSKTVLFIFLGVFFPESRSHSICKKLSAMTLAVIFVDKPLIGHSLGREWLYSVPSIWLQYTSANCWRHSTVFARLMAEAMSLAVTSQLGENFCMKNRKCTWETCTIPSCNRPFLSHVVSQVVKRHLQTKGGNDLLVISSTFVMVIFLVI